METKDVLNKLLAHENDCDAIQPGGKGHELRSMLLEIMLETSPEEWGDDWLSWLIDVIASPMEYFGLVIEAANALRRAVEAGNTTALWFEEDILDAVQEAERNFPMPMVFGATSKLRACLTPRAADSPPASR